jgi:nicotinate-nucleotide pyrophosphorylase (carboxylating)
MIPDFSIQAEAYKDRISQIIIDAWQEDTGSGDHTTLACLSPDETVEAKLICKDSGVIAGVELANMIPEILSLELKIKNFINDGDLVKAGDRIMLLSGKAQHILSVERLLLNCMQHMSAIATKTHNLCELIKDYPVKILDTRKTTPGIRLLEKWAVKIGGGENYRFGLYDMIMIKDNHVDYSGGIKAAVSKVKQYLQENHLKLGVVVEVRNFDELKEVLELDSVDRVMLDNFSPEEIRKAVNVIKGKIQTEASGGINAQNIVDYASAGVDFISTSMHIKEAGGFDLSLVK